jgi:hypothetical protein
MLRRGAMRWLVVIGAAMAAPTCGQALGAGTAHGGGHLAAGRVAAQKRAAVAVTTRQANAMQAAAVAHGEANTALSNPYIEQEVTTPESTGLNGTGVPAGGF